MTPLEMRESAFSTSCVQALHACYHKLAYALQRISLHSRPLECCVQANDKLSTSQIVVTRTLTSSTLCSSNSFLAWCANAAGIAYYNDRPVTHQQKHLVRRQLSSLSVVRTNAGHVRTLSWRVTRRTLPTTATTCRSRSKQLLSMSVMRPRERNSHTHSVAWP